MARSGRRVGEPGAQLGEEVELVGELGVERRVGDVAAGRDVEIVDDGAGGQARGDVAGVAAGAEVAVAGASSSGRRDRMATPL